MDHRVFPLLCVLLLLVACNTGGPGFAGQTGTDIHRAGMDFRVFHDAEHARVIRTSMGRPRNAPLFRAAVISVIEEASGCTADAADLNGDWNLVEGPIRCPPP
ncbi:MAG: hypothetical protein ABNH26_09355 [Celeribacter sp.]|jgi:hypothetical protein